ncbi:MAG: hypothetical protein J2P50_14085 [Hyphomicrobiaceae bacterium]|nr:hypothetical protein [Hyphomicrobiaceae bacterium]
MFKLSPSVMPAPSGFQTLTEFQLTTIANLVKAVAGPNPPHGVASALVGLAHYQDIHAARDLADAAAREGFIGLAAGIDSEVSP